MKGRGTLRQPFTLTISTDELFEMMSDMIGQAITDADGAPNISNIEIASNGDVTVSGDYETSYRFSSSPATRWEPEEYDEERDCYIDASVFDDLQKLGLKAISYTETDAIYPEKED